MGIDNLVVDTHKKCVVCVVRKKIEEFRKHVNRGYINTCIICEKRIRKGRYHATGK